MSGDGIGGDEALRHFVGKWQVREPEMAFAEVFCIPAQKPLFRIWGALLHELREALFELSDARITDIKLAWWAEELMGWGQGRSRHPLGDGLRRCVAPWSELGRALLESGTNAVRTGNTSEAIAALSPLAAAVIEVEAALFATEYDEASVRCLAVHWLLQRLPAGLAADDQARIPMHLFARHGLTAAQLAGGQGKALLCDWASELAEALPQPHRASVLRRARAAFDRARLRRLAAGKGFAAPPAVASLWRAWQAARSA
jgi:hypothetical protein